jgi:hypothetical protein
LAGDQFFRDLQRHALHVGEKQACGKTDSQKTSPRAVADYLYGGLGAERLRAGGSEEGNHKGRHPLQQVLNAESSYYLLPSLSRIAENSGKCRGLTGKFYQ